MTYEDIKNNEEVRALIRKGNANLGMLGYTDHSEAHTALVAENAAKILAEFGYGKKEQELAKIAGFMHDIGNAINRKNHAEYGGILANEILRQYDLDMEDRITIISAISNHDESTAFPVNPIAAALILADKTDVRYTRVRNIDPSSFDIHDKVNYSVKKAELTYEKGWHITLSLTIDTSMCVVMDYFEIFLGRMKLCRKAAEKLGLEFRLNINGQQLI